MTAIVFMDTETTGLALSDDIWEFAAIRREEDGTESELHLFIEHDGRKCRNLPESFKADHKRRWPGFSEQVTSKWLAARQIYQLTADCPHIVGAVPNFDTERLALLLREFGHEPGWHYHLIDVENLAVGYLAGHSEAYRMEVDASATLPAAATLPWNSDDLSRAVGVEPAGPGVRHTAMGDARWARAIYDKVMGGAR